MTMDKRQQQRDSLITGWSDRLGNVADYAGVGWDDAVEAVLDIMVDEARLPVDAINVYRERQTQKVRKSVRTLTTHTVTAYRVPKAVLDIALDLAGGDITRLRLDPDGSVTVVNQGKADR